MSRAVMEQGLAWAVVVGIVAAVWLGRKRGRANLAAQVASAHAAGFAEGGKAAAAAYAQQSVTVAVDNSNRDRATGSAPDHECLDPWRCVVCAPVLHRVARASIRRSPDVPAAIDRGTDYDHDDDDDRSGYNGPAVVRSFRTDPSPSDRGIPVARSGSAAGGAGGHGRGPGR